MIPYEKLCRCHPSAQWLFDKLSPRLRQSTLLGYLDQSEAELAAELFTSHTTISHALNDLKHHGVMRKSNAGYWYCPAIIAECFSAIGRRHEHGLRELPS